MKPEIGKTYRCVSDGILNLETLKATECTVVAFVSEDASAVEFKGGGLAIVSNGCLGQAALPMGDERSGVLRPS